MSACQVKSVRAQTPLIFFVLMASLLKCLAPMRLSNNPPPYWSNQENLCPIFLNCFLTHCKNEKWQQASMIGEALIKSLLCNKWVWMIWSQIRILVMAKNVGKYVHVTSTSIPKHYSYWYHATLQKQDF